ncbi:PREDICTED: uncharacterized protein LOC106806980 [Priapulus caudatus]|uniref:Uncharacterized protein LOC106806980 n=1 Tax=Priapulus caudatus TaxID=37621 RepID=A0ABM1DXJ2_PRICU|nr:PREDICTED: uncharacterized protein LOC106806980 [Priapulus caudatus]
MNIVNRESDEPSIYANLKVFGREITFVDLYGADIVRGIMNEGMVSLPNIERKLREGYDLTFTKIQPLVMARTIVPTHAGLPLQLHLCGVKVITNKGVVRGSFEPALYQTQRLNIPNSLTLTADIVPRVIVDIVGNMTVKLATFSAGAGITAQLAVEKPIRGSVNIDIATKQLTVDMEPVETTELEVAKFEVKPVTYFIRTPFTSFVSRHAYVSGPSYYQEELITGEESSIPYEYTYETDCPAFGKRALYAARLNMPLPGAPHMPFNGYQLLAIRTRPITPRQVQFVLKLTNNAANIPRVQTSRWSIHSPSPIMSEQPYTYAIYAAVKSQGDQVFHEALLSYQYSEYFKKQYVSLEVTGQEYIFNVNGRVLFPEIDVSIRRPLSELTGMLGNVEGELNIEWSHRQQAKKAVQIMFTSEKTAEQLEYEPERLREIYETERTPRQWRASESFTELRQMTFIVRNYEEIPEYLAEYMYKYHLYTMGKLWSYIGEHEVTFRSAPRYTPGQIKFITKLYPNNRQVDVIIESPQQKVSYLRLPLPFALEPLSYRRSVFTNYIQKVTGDTYCELYSNNQLRTFDAVNYTLPLKSCEHILAKDCSSDNAYTVVLSKDSTTNKKIVKIMTEGKTVEIMTPTKVIVDGAPINAQEEYIVRKDPSNASSKVVLKVMYEAANLVTVKAPEIGLIVSSDGASVKIELPNRYRSKLCGLCGDFNSEMKDELVGPKREIYTNLHHFVKSYVIPNSCQVNGDYESYGAYRPYEYETEQGNAYNRAYEPESGVYGERTFEPESGVYGERPFEPESGVYGERTFEPESGVYGERTYEPESGVYGERPWESKTGVYGTRGYGIGSNEYGVRPYDSEDESIQYSWPTNAYDYENPDFIRPELEDEFEESRLPVDTLFGHGTVRKTMVIETDQFPPQICFSVVPIVDCQQGYYPEPSVSKQLKETGFTCIDAREPSAVEKKREAMIRVLPEMATKTIHRKQIVEEPKQCTQRY